MIPLMLWPSDNTVKLSGKKDVSTINDYIYYESDEQVNTISDSNKQVDSNSDPKEENHIIDIIRKLSVRPILFDPAAFRVIGQDLVTSVQETSRVDLSLKSLSLLNTISSEEIVTGAACNTAQVDRNIWNPSRVRTPEVNVDVFSTSHGSNFIFTKWSRNIKPLDTSVDRSATQERNSDISYI